MAGKCELGFLERRRRRKKEKRERSEDKNEEEEEKKPGQAQFIWEKLSPAEFQQLQDLTAYSNKRLADVLAEFEPEGKLANYDKDEDIDFRGFKVFLDLFLEADAPEELSRHLFLSFVRPVPTVHVDNDDNNNNSANVEGRTMKEMADKCTKTALAAATPGAASAVSESEPGFQSLPSSIHHGLSEKLHGLTELLHINKPNNEDVRQRTGSLGARERLSVTQPPEITRKLSSHCSSPARTFSRASSKKSNHSQRIVSNGKLDESARRALASARPHKLSLADLHSVKVPLKDVICYLSLLEGGRPEDKLEFMFRLYDTDDNGYLDNYEMDSIVDQMMTVAEYMGWETQELRPILEEMMVEIDYDSDGTVSLQEWKRGGMTTIPLLVLLGLDTHVKEDGNHLWRLKHFKMSSYCNLCLNMLAGMGRKGLCCTLCKYTVHERCVQRAPASCISTYVKSSRTPPKMVHHWVEGNRPGKCGKCRKPVKCYNGITGLHCRWCQITLHNKCARHVSPECRLGANRMHVLPPVCICPTVLDRQRSLSKEKQSHRQRAIMNEEMSDSLSNISRSDSTNDNLSGAAGSFQITPFADTHPLLVFVNPKSGGRQGSRLLRKFQYLLNPRQVYDLSKEDPRSALNTFRDVPRVRVVVCGGDGTVGWVLESLDKISFTHQPSVLVIPLGTGNDLARCLRWGGGYEGESVSKILRKIERAEVTLLDRWSLTIVQQEPEESRTGEHSKIPFNIFNNYFSIGVDAAICCKFHLERERNPQKFNNRMKNKLWYFEYATSESFASSCKNLHENVEIVCDGNVLNLSEGPALQGLAVLNIPSTHGGTNMWGDSKTRRLRRRPKHNDSSEKDLATAIQDIGDGLIEVVGLESCLHMGQVRTGLRSSGKRLAQCSSLLVRTNKHFPMQIDGEPWEQPPCTMEIKHQSQVPMLSAAMPKARSLFCFLPKDLNEDNFDDDNE